MRFPPFSHCVWHPSPSHSLLTYLYHFQSSSVLELFDFNFPENGLVAFEQGKLIHSKVRPPYML